MGRYRYAEKGFSLLETIVAVAVTAVGTVFILRAFTVSLNAVRRSGDIRLACSIAEEKLWEAAFRQMRSGSPIPALWGAQKQDGKDYAFECESRQAGSTQVFDLSARISWDKDRLEIGAKVLGGL